MELDSEGDSSDSDSDNADEEEDDDASASDDNNDDKDMLSEIPTPIIRHSSVQSCLSLLVSCKQI